MKNLIIQKPTDPIDYMIKFLEKPEIRRVFLVGPPGSRAKEYGLEIADSLKLNTINVGELLK